MTRVLIVDANISTAFLLANALARHGHVARQAICAAQARELSADGWPEVALVDLGLEAGSAAALADDLCALGVPVIGTTHNFLQLNSWQGRCERVLLKPISTAELLHGIQQNAACSTR